MTAGQAWSSRSQEQARLLNPSFLGLLVWACARGYSSTSADGLPYPLAFLSMPIVLHRNTRQKLPKTVRRTMAAWLIENTEVQVGFAERASALVPLVSEGIIFAANGGLLSLVDGELVSARRPRSMAGFLREATNEVRSCLQKAEFVGKWLGRSGDYATVMALWGVAP